MIEDSRVTVFTVANATYEPFVLPYIASVLHHNADAYVEIALDDPEKFRVTNSAALGLLEEAHAGCFGLRKSATGLGPHATQRFLMTPEHRSPFVYIGDIDIVVLEAIVEPHLNHMTATGLPYSNVRRPNVPRLTGLHFSRWTAYYPLDPAVLETQLAHDEAVLFELVTKHGHPLPDISDNWRPTHGLHVSLNRRPSTGWRLANQYFRPYVKLSEDQLWQALIPLMDPRIGLVLTIIEMGFAHKFPGKLSENSTLPLPRDWWQRLRPL